MFALAVVAVLALGDVDRPKLAVLELTAGTGVDAATTGPIGEAITAEVQRAGYFQVISQRDISTMLGFDRQKQLLGCGEDTSSCLAELSGALGTRFVMSGTLARLGDAYQLTLNTLDTQKAQPLGRSTRLAKDLAALQGQLRSAVAEATATPQPAPPSRVFPFSLLGVGAASAVLGVVFSVLALNHQAQVQGQLDSGETRPGVLDTRDYYLGERSAIERDKWLGVGLLVVGVALAVAGFLLMPRDS